MLLVRWKPVLHCPPQGHRRRGFAWPRGPRRSLLLRRPIRSAAPAFLSISSSKFSQAGRARVRPVVRAGLAQTPSLADVENTEILFSETLSLKRSQTVEGKITVRLDPAVAEEEVSKWRLTIGCNLEGKWTLHWGVSYCDDLGSEWDQPPPEMRPPESVLIKDYAIETPLKRLSSQSERQALHELQIEFDSNTPIAAIHFVLKEEETGAWFQHKGRDFRISFTDYFEVANSVGGNQGLSIWPGGFDQISSLLLKAEESTSKKEDPDDEDGNVVKQNRCIAPIYKEFPILKEEFVPNHMTVSVRSSDKTDKNIVQFDTDLPGDVVIHWGVCKDDGRKWVIPSTPHPPATKIFRHKALQTLLQPKPDGLGSWGLFLVDQGTSGVVFVLKLNEYTWLNNNGTDFFIPIGSVSSTTAEIGSDDIVHEQQAGTEIHDVRNSLSPNNSYPLQNKSLEASDPKNINSLPMKPQGPEELIEAVAYTDEIIKEIRHLVTDISSEKGKRAKSKEAQENILQEIEKLAAEAYSIFRISIPGFVELASDTELLKPAVKLSSGTGSGYEILCQGFNWESHKSGRWYSELSDKAKELSSLGFTVIWLPPPTESVSPEGYMPKDLYNLNSRYGSLEELKDLVNSFHEVGIKVLGDAVLNHRCAHFQNKNGIWNVFGGRLNWDDRAIVADDPHFQGRGNKSSGDNFHAAPNIDHSQDFVRRDLKEWLCWLRKEVGYDGWRLDFVRGFWGGYVKDYMEATEPYFAVGEYWDSLSYTYGDMDHNQDAHRQRIVDWINATNGTAGAFDVTTKGILHSALEKCEYWRLSDQNGKPPGVVGWWASRAVTFIENHDTGSTQGHWRFPSGKEMQGYAYILTHPGTPAVFYDHIFSHYQQEISRLISVRNENKIHCRSTVKIVKAERDVYAAEIDGKLAVKIGPGHYEPPDGPTKWVVAAEGRDYKVWETS
uniref:alpha-amylase n=1 Tax=Musa acuminata subsp. malaccensis TaxID=214687 RepID=A0A804K2P6_MUSAM|nr:PREDICTED: alpha-amylase 3, chloroplastic [Musa acuminata subsp. malaccensis]